MILAPGIPLIIKTMKSIGLLRPFAMIYLIFLLTATVSIAQASREITKEAIDAVQDKRIDFVEKATQQNSDRLAAFITEMAALRSSIDRFTGIGIGLGSALTMLQLIQVLLQTRRRSTS
jgi:hypothetical protein